MRIYWAAEIRVSVTLVCLVLCIPGTLGSEFVWCGFGYSGWGVARRGMECRLIKNHHVLLILNVVPECLMSLYLFRLRCVSRTSVCRTSRPISRYQSYLSCHYCRCNPLYASYCDCTLTFSNTVIISCQETCFIKLNCLKFYLVELESLKLQNNCFLSGYDVILSLVTGDTFLSRL